MPNAHLVKMKTMHCILLLLLLLLSACTISEYNDSGANAAAVNDSENYSSSYKQSSSSKIQERSSSSYSSSSLHYSSSLEIPDLTIESSSSSSKIEDLFFVSSSSYYSSSSQANVHSFTDSRDGTKYRYVTIGTQTWMAENLNYASTDSYCYRDEPSYCSKYGRMYSFESAQDACPSGWHLASYNEWATLNNYLVSEGLSVGGSLRATTFNGTDKFGFKVLPGGYCYYPTYMGEGGTTRFWTSSQESSLYGYAFSFTTSETGMPTQHHDFRAYARCVMDRLF